MSNLIGPDYDKPCPGCGIALGNAAGLGICGACELKGGNVRDCHHGSLRRSCELCERDQEIATLTRERDEAREQAAAHSRDRMMNADRAMRAEAERDAAVKERDHWKIEAEGYQRAVKECADKDNKTSVVLLWNGAEMRVFGPTPEREIAMAEAVAGYIELVQVVAASEQEKALKAELARIRAAAIAILDEYMAGRNDVEPWEPSGNAMSPWSHVLPKWRALAAALNPPTTTTKEDR